MGRLSPDWARIHGSKSFGFWSLPLAACSFPYSLGSRFRPWAYSKGLFKSKSLPGFVVSIGNLTAGGTGKTPATVMLAGWAQQKGYRVAVLSRGYGGSYREKVLVVSDGKRLRASAAQAGDEPYLLAGRLPSVPVVVSKSRYDAGLHAHEKYGADFFILDDGFQHIQLNRDLNLVLIDAVSPFGNGHLLPWGPLREPLSQMSRADVFIVTRSGHPYPRSVDIPMEKFPSVPVFYADHKPSQVVLPLLPEHRPPEFIKGERVLGFAGIARPELFRKTLEDLGANIVFFKGFDDHHPYRKEDLDSLAGMMKTTGARYLMTTEKDWVRIAHLNDLPRKIAYLGVEFEFLSGYDTFFQLVEERVQSTRLRAK